MAFQQVLPPIYPEGGQFIHPNYPNFKPEIGNYCSSVNRVAEAVFEESRSAVNCGGSPNVVIKFLGFFGLPYGGDRRNEGMDGGERAVWGFIGALVAGVGAFLIFKHIADCRDADEKIEHYASFRGRFASLWNIHDHPHVNDIRVVADAELDLAERDKKNAMINLALNITIIASGAIMVVGALFASVSLVAIGGAAFLVTGVLCLAKLGMTIFENKDSRNLMGDYRDSRYGTAQKIIDACVRLRGADVQYCGNMQYGQQPLPHYPQYPLYPYNEQGAYNQV